VSIVRIGLGETRNFAEGYEAIFGKKKPHPSGAAKKAARNKKRTKTKKK
jgi:hypothetical protein